MTQTRDADITNGSLDGFLGPASRRYFGEGYRKVKRSLSEIHHDAAQDVYLVLAQLTYPLSWSVKSDTTLIPHLSSVDVLSLVTDGALAAASARFGIHASDIDVESIQITAGTVAVEELGAIPLRLQFGAQHHAPNGGGTTQVAFTVASMRGQVTLRHPASTVAAPVMDRYIKVDESATRLRVDHHSVVNAIAVDAEVGEVSGIARVTATGLNRVSMLDALVGSAQLAQILLYEIDRIDRSTSNTLWMRKLTLTAPSADPAVQTNTDFPALLRARRTSIVHANRARWRSADLELVEFGGHRATCLVAHQLPEEWA